MEHPDAVALPSAVKATYIGSGAFVMGIPARDISVEEWDAMSTETQAAIARCGLYEMAESKE